MAKKKKAAPDEPITMKEKANAFASRWLLNVEAFIIAVFAICFVAFTYSQCNRSQQVAAGDPPATDSAAVASPQQTAAQQEAARLQALLDAPPSIAAPADQTATIKPEEVIAQAPDLQKLFVTLDGLKVRSKPGLEGTTLTRLKLHDEVLFMNEKTPYREELKLNADILAYEPWIKIKTATGQEGWVYGAGVHYYKMDRLKE